MTTQQQKRIHSARQRASEYMGRLNNLLRADAMDQHHRALHIAEVRAIETGLFAQAAQQCREFAPTVGNTELAARQQAQAGRNTKAMEHGATISAFLGAAAVWDHPDPEDIAEWRRAIRGAVVSLCNVWMVKRGIPADKIIPVCDAIDAVINPVDSMQMMKEFAVRVACACNRHYVALAALGIEQAEVGLEA